MYLQVKFSKGTKKAIDELSFILEENLDKCNVTTVALRIFVRNMPLTVTSAERSSIKLKLIKIPPNHTHKHATNKE